MVLHPLIDDVCGRVIVVDSVAPVVWLTEAMADLLNRALVAGRIVLLRTGPDAALTPAMRHALSAAGGAWAVTDFDGTMRDGRTGAVAQSIDDFAARGPELRGTPSPEHPVATESVAQVTVDLTVRHHPERTIDLGGAIEVLCDAAGCRPDRWGVSEPLTVPWDRWVLTQYAKHVAPAASTSYAVGDGVSATITARMRDGMVVETMSTVLTAPPEGSARVLEAVREVAADVVPVFGVVMDRRGDADHLARAVSYGEPEPAAVVVGPEVASFLRDDNPEGVEYTEIEQFGGTPDEGALVRLVGGWGALESFLDRIDAQRFLTLVGGAPLEAAALDGAIDEHVLGQYPALSVRTRFDGDARSRSGGSGAA